MRTKFIAGNWKMNPASLAEAVDLATKVKAGVGNSTAVHVAVCPTFVHLTAVDPVLDGSPVGLGAQDLYWEAKGAFTGEISADMLKDVGCTHVIIGHSERRKMGETDEQVNKKLQAALGAQLIPIVCIGETDAERDAGQTFDVIRGQLDGSLAEIEGETMAGIVLAYEPVWAIGTGRTATPEQAQEVHAFIRGRLTEKFGEAIAARVVIQYGGSVTGEKAPGLLTQPDIDGALVGGASLKADDFLAIIAAARTA